MTYQFSFNEKNEIVIYNDRLFISKIGALIEALIDISWIEISDEVQLTFEDLFFIKQDGIDFLRENLENKIHHPVFIEHLMQAQNKSELVHKIQELSDIKSIAIKIFESLVDEQKQIYSNIIFELLYIKSPELLLMDFIKAEDTHLVPFKERNLPVYSGLKDYKYIFKTEEVRTIIFQEIQFFCANDFLLRKCLYCKKFFWTRKMNNTYCDRINEETKKTCSQIGPTQRCLSKRTEAYNEYWNKRTRIFNRHRNGKNKHIYLAWLNRTNPYKELAKNNKISLEEMRVALEKIETEVYEELA